MLLRAAAPAVRLSPRTRLAPILLDLSALGTAEPLIVALQRLVDRTEVVERELGFVKESSAWVRTAGSEWDLWAKAVVHAEVLLSRTLLFAQAVDERSHGHGQSRWIRIGGHLRLELRRYSAASLLAEDLLAGDPAIIINQVNPVFENLKTGREESQ